MESCDTEEPAVQQEYAHISIVIPTLNSSETLKNCLAAIHAQTFDQKRIELVIADAGSSDGTPEIAREYGATVVENPLKTGEAGKSAGIAAAGGDIIALIDSDNILDDEQWLEKMMPALENPEVVARYSMREGVAMTSKPVPTKPTTVTGCR